MNHNIGLKVINADVHGGYGDGEEGERGDVDADQVVGKLPLQNHNEVGLSSVGVNKRVPNLELWKVS